MVRFLAPLVFGLTVVGIWEMLVRGLDVPLVILPAPSVIALRFADSLPILWADFVQTIIKGAFSGYVIGCGAAFLMAIAVDRWDFLRLGLLPVGNFVAALPIVGEGSAYRKIGVPIVGPVGVAEDVPVGEPG